MLCLTFYTFKLLSAAWHGWGRPSTWYLLKFYKILTNVWKVRAKSFLYFFKFFKSFFHSFKKSNFFYTVFPIKKKYNLTFQWVSRKWWISYIYDLCIRNSPFLWYSLKSEIVFSLVGNTAVLVLTAVGFNMKYLYQRFEKTGFHIDLIVTKPLIDSQKLKLTSDKKIGIMGLLYIYK